MSTSSSQDATHSRAQPTRIGRYEIVRELARGGMGVVYRARDPRLNRDVALKVLQEIAGATEGELERFKREAQATAGLRHPNIVPVFDYGQEGAYPFLVMDLIEGESLSTRVDRAGPLDLAEAARIVATLASALGYAHANGVLHRDVKPANVLLTEGGEPLLTDFGLAKQVDVTQARGLTVSGQVIGTPAFMPPEQAKGELERVDERSDVYSLGATLYELLVGRPPFTGPTVLNILAAVVEKDPVAPRSLRPELHPDLETICLKCLEKDPDQRYETAGELADELGRFLRHEPIEARPPTSLERGVRWVRRNPALTLAYVLGVSLVIVAAVAWSTRRRDVPYYMQRGQQFAIHGELVAAEESFSQALALDGQHLEALRSRGAVYVGMGFTVRAIADFDRITTLDPSYPLGLEAAEAFKIRGHEHLEGGQFTKAIHALTRAIEIEPANSRHWTLRGWSYAKRLDREEALADLNRALQLRPDDADALCKRSATLFAMNRLDAALADADLALKYKPHYADALRVRSQIRFNRDDFQGAEEDASRVLQGDSDNVTSLVARAQARVRLANFEGALADFDRALELEPSHPYYTTFLARAVTRLRTGDPQGAREDANRALDLESDHPQALLIRGQARLTLQEFEGAVEDLSRAQEQDPGSVTINKALGTALGAVERLDDAVIAYGRAISTGGVDSDALLGRAMALLRLGDLTGAQEDMSRVLSILSDPEGPRRSKVKRIVQVTKDRIRTQPMEPKKRDRQLMSLAAAAQNSSRHEQAIRLATIVVQRSPEWASAYLGRAQSQLALGQYQGSVADCDRVLQRSPLSAAAFYLRGRAREGLGDLPGAVGDAERALELFPHEHPGHLPAKAFLEDLRSRGN